MQINDNNSRAQLSFGDAGVKNTTIEGDLKSFKRY